MAAPHKSPRDLRSGLSYEEMHNIAALHPSVTLQPDGAVAFDGITVDAMRRAYGTPLIIYSERRLGDNAAAMRAAFNGMAHTVHVAFALKSCYFRQCAHAIRAAGAGVEIMSEIELQIATQCGWHGADIVANGAGKTNRYLADIIDADVRMVVIDTVDELARLSTIAAGKRQRVPVALRIAGQLPPGEPMLIPPGRKLAFDLSAPALIEAVRMLEEDRYCALVGLHVHQLSHGATPADVAAPVRNLVGFAKQLHAERGLSLEMINIGGGIESRYLLARGGTSIDDIARAVADELRALPYSFALVCEPGRFVAGDAAIGVTSIVGSRRGPENWMFVDLASNVLIPLPDITYHAIPARLRGDVGSFEPHSVSDRICTPNRFCRDALLPLDESAGLLMLLNCGAYTTVFSEIWGVTLPKVLMLRADGTFDFLFDERAQANLYRQFYGYEISLWN